ncbi:L-lactate dehydrogenase [Candidatus Peregrinibacteria bacterium]|nr:MAG: L-lactate dehydrogenase [Candidatus Peregrinibacteria bacterium]
MSKACTLPSFQTQFKVTVIGAGNVGATAAYAMLMDGTPTELVLIDRNREKAEGLVLDMEHSMAFFNATKVVGTDDYAYARNSHLVVITAGARQQEGETRLDLIAKNRAIMKDIVPKIMKVAPRALLLVVSNPVDVLTYEVYKLSGLPWGRVFGSGTLLDTARLRFHLGEALCLSPKSIEAFILGEHGDTSFPVWSSANVAGKALMKMPGFTKSMANAAYKDTREAAYRIIHDVGYTCYSIGTVIREIMVHIFQHSRVVLPLSVPLEKGHDYCGVRGIALSVPCILDSTGVTDLVSLPLNALEKKALKKSAAALKSAHRN